MSSPWLWSLLLLSGVLLVVCECVLVQERTSSLLSSQLQPFSCFYSSTSQKTDTDFQRPLFKGLSFHIFMCFHVCFMCVLCVCVCFHILCVFYTQLTHFLVNYFCAFLWSTDRVLFLSANCCETMSCIFYFLEYVYKQDLVVYQDRSLIIYYNTILAVSYFKKILLWESHAFTSALKFHNQLCGSEKSHWDCMCIIHATQSKQRMDAENTTTALEPGPSNHLFSFQLIGNLIEIGRMKGMDVLDHVKNIVLHREKDRRISCFSVSIIMV